jgi:hypothetical protein
MFVVVATLSNRMQSIRNSVRRLHLLNWLFVNILFSGKRTLKNIGGRPEETMKMKDLSGVLVERRRAFLDQAAFSTEITAFQILDGVANISTRLQYPSSQVSDAGR